MSDLTHSSVPLVYESPDGGNTVYARAIGSEPQTRILANAEAMNNIVHLSDLINRQCMTKEIVDAIKKQDLNTESLASLKRWLPLFDDIQHDQVLKEAMDKVLVYWELKHGKKD